MYNRLFHNFHLPPNAGHQQRGPVHTQLDENSGMPDLVRFMAQCKLISIGLVQFNDHPEYLGLGEHLSLTLSETFISQLVSSSICL